MQLDEATDPWGIKVSKVEVFNILCSIFVWSLILIFARWKTFDCLKNCRERWQPKPRQLGKREPRSKNNHSSNQLDMASDCHVLHLSDCPCCQILQKIRWSLLRVSRRRAGRWRRPPTSSQSPQQLYNLGQYFHHQHHWSRQTNIFN